MRGVGMTGLGLSSESKFGITAREGGQRRIKKSGWSVRTAQPPAMLTGDGVPQELFSAMHFSVPYVIR